MYGPIRLAPAHLSLTLLLLSACSTDPARQANFNRCLADDRACDATLLTPEQQQQIYDWHKERHFEDCLAGLRCDERALSAEERRQVRETVAQRNFQVCLQAEAHCDKAMLTASQRSEVEQTDRARNFALCMGGLPVCDETTLTEFQLTAVRDAYLQRNFSGCMNAVGTLLRCNPDDLSAEQRELVHRRNLATNLYACTNHAFGCDESLLTPEQREKMDSNSGPR